MTVDPADPACFGGYVTEYVLAPASAADLTADELVRLQRNALQI